MQLLFSILLWSAATCHGRRISQLGLSSSLEDTSPKSLKTLASFLLAPSSMLRTRSFFSGAPPISQLRINPRHSLPIAQLDVAQEDLLRSFLDASPDELESRVQDSLGKLGVAELREIYSRAQSDKSWLKVQKIIDELRHRSMLAAKELLEEVLSSGEIRKMDAKISALAKNKQIDPAFLAVVSENIQAAMKDGDEMRSNLLQHISTRVSEELEKQAKPEVGILTKLMRMDDIGIRANILNHYLVPQTSIELPDGKKMELDSPQPAIVHPMQFSEAVSHMVKEVRSMGFDDAVSESTIEALRDRAIEARAVIVENYPESVVDEFSDSLTPIFQPARAVGR